MQFSKLPHFYPIRSFTEHMLDRVEEYSTTGNLGSQWVVSRGIGSLGIAGALLLDAIREVILCVLTAGCALNNNIHRHTTSELMDRVNPLWTLNNVMGCQEAWVHLRNAGAYSTAVIAAPLLGAIAPSKLLIPVMTNLGFITEKSLLKRIKQATGNAILGSINPIWTDDLQQPFSKPYPEWTPRVRVLEGGYLDLFYKFYQTCEISQWCDLSKSQQQYLMPEYYKAQVQEYVDELADFYQYGTTLKKTKAFQCFQQTETCLRGHRVMHSTSPNAPQWLIRGHMKRNVLAGPPQALRVVMNKRCREVIKTHRLSVTLPDEFLCRVPHHERERGASDDGYDFFVVSEKFNIMHEQDGIDWLKAQNQDRQMQVVTMICKFIYHTGFIDAHFGNITFKTEGQDIAIVDTEPCGLFIDSSQRPYRNSPLPLSAARVRGLTRFISTLKSHNFSAFDIKIAENYLLHARLLQGVKFATFGISICPLIPVVILICSVVYQKFKISKAGSNGGNLRQVSDFQERSSLAD